MNYADTHLCGSPYEDPHCKHLLYANKPGMTHGKKALRQYDLYCLSEGRCRSLGNIATNTGCSPKWCPKRRERGV